jgi:RNA polymerase sigma factor (sigma-70 family)
MTEERKLLIGTTQRKPDDVRRDGVVSSATEEQLSEAITDILRQHWSTQSPCEMCFDHDKSRMERLMAFLDGRAASQEAEEVKAHLLECPRCRFIYARSPMTRTSTSMTRTSTSLLQRLGDPNDSAAWARLTLLYTPLIRRWLGRQLRQEADVEDVAQQVFTVIVQEGPAFQHNGHPGAFRAWLRAICVNCLRKFWSTRPPTIPNPEAILQQLEDPHSDLSQKWDREDDKLVYRRALELIKGEFKTKTWLAFQRVALDGQQPAVVAAELGLSVHAVFIAKTRVLARLRKEIEGLV